MDRRRVRGSNGLDPSNVTNHSCARVSKYIIYNTLFPFPLFFGTVVSSSPRLVSTTSALFHSQTPCTCVACHFSFTVAASSRLYTHDTHIFLEPPQTSPYICATLYCSYASGVGVFELHINGAKVGDHFLDPGEAVYDQKVLFVGFNVTQLLRSGTNAIGARLGNSKW